MSTRLFVGNLAWKSTDASLEELFAGYGNVVSARIITDRDTGKSRGFAFVEMETEEGAKTAMDSLNNYDFEGRVIRVSEARERQQSGHSNQRSHR